MLLENSGSTPDNVLLLFELLPLSVKWSSVRCLLSSLKRLEYWLLQVCQKTFTHKANINVSLFIKISLITWSIKRMSWRYITKSILILQKVSLVPSSVSLRSLEQVQDQNTCKETRLDCHTIEISKNFLTTRQVKLRNMRNIDLAEKLLSLKKEF